MANKKTAFDKTSADKFKSSYVPGGKGGQQYLAAQDIFKKQAEATGNAFFSVPMPYQPEFGDPSKINFPIDRHQSNRYARMFYRTDPVFGSVIDLFAELLTSDIEVYGEGVVGDVKRKYEEMIHSTKIVSLFSYFIKEFLIVGEVIPHLIFDERKGIWTDLIFHNPDQVNVIDSPFINMEPILEFVPDEALRKFAQTNHPQVLDILNSIPQDVVGAITSGQNIPLNTKLNVSFLARKLFPYDVRGTGIFPRMWQILMYEQAVYNAAIATARRHSGPIKVAKMGDPASVEGDHFIVVKDTNNNLDILSFDSMWNKYDGTTAIKNDKEIKILKDKLTTLSLDSNGIQNWTPISSILRHRTPEKVVSVKTPVATIRSTDEHGYMWLNPTTAKYEKVSSNKLKERKHPCVVTMPSFNYSTDATMVFGEHISEDLAYYLGVWTADGQFRSAHSNILRITSIDNGIINKLVDIAKHNVWISDFSIKKPKNRNIYHIDYISKDIKNNMMNYYGFSKTRGSSICRTGIESIPNEILFNTNTNIVAAMLAGQIDGDGTIADKVGHGIRVTHTCSKKLVHQLSLSLLRFGILSNVRMVPKKCNSSKILYYLEVDGKSNLTKLYNLVRPYINHSLKGERFDNLIKSLENIEERNQFNHVYDFEKNIVLDLFKDEDKNTIKHYYNRSRIRYDKIITKGVDCIAKQQVEKFHSVSVNSIKEVNKKCEYVYDLMLDTDPHTYLVGGEGWLLNHNTGWIPPQEHFDDLAQRLTLLEQDPHGWLIYHYGIAFDTIGTTDRMMSISREYDLIERVKLTALGVSQGFLHGESTYASSKVNFNTLISKLQGMRKFFESMWFHNKFFKPIAEINEWVKPTHAEVSHRLRKKRTASEIIDEDRLIIPKIKWRQSLEPVVDKDMLDALRLLSDLGIKASKTTAFSAAGLDFEGETVNGFTESKIEKKIKEKILGPEAIEKGPEDVAKELLTPPGISSPMSTPEELPTPKPEEGEATTETPSEEKPIVERTEGEEPPMEPAPASKLSKRGFRVTANDVDDLIDMMDTGKTDSDIWGNLRSKKENIKDFVKNCDWDRVSDYMEDEGFTDSEIEYVRKALIRKGILEPTLTDKVEDAMNTLNIAAATDPSNKIEEKIKSVLDNKLKSITELVNKKAEKSKSEIDNFLVGEGSVVTRDFVIMNNNGANLTKDKIANFRKRKE